MSRRATTSSRASSTTKRRPGPATLWMSSTGAMVALRAPLDVNVNDALRALPAGARTWDRAERTWLICPLVLTEVLEILRATFEVVTVHPGVHEYAAELRAAMKRAAARDLRRRSRLAGALVIDLADARRRLGVG